jgi:hypothetical protein
VDLDGEYGSRDHDRDIHPDIASGEIVHDFDGVDLDGAFGGGGEGGSDPGSGYAKPVALDLDGDGLEMVSRDESTAFFDIDADGFRENVGWVGGDDGFLTIDKDNSGTITGEELAFAEDTEDETDTDLEALATLYDSNSDGKLNNLDADWGKFRVWRDLDQDGVTDPGELQTMAEAGIVEIDLTSDGVAQTLDGNHVFGKTTFTKTGGGTGAVYDVALSASDAGIRFSEDGTSVELDLEAVAAKILEVEDGQSIDIDAGLSGHLGVFGAELDDRMVSSGIKDVLFDGGAGNDVLQGGAGDDFVIIEPVRFKYLASLPALPPLAQQVVG